MSAILVPVDGSSHSLKAIRIACDLAEKYGGVIAVMHVLVPGRKADKILDLPVARNLPATVQAELKSAAAKADRKITDTTLRAVGAGILADAEARVTRRGLEARVLDLGTGDPAETILLAISETGAGTIVMGCRGTSEGETPGMGSVSQKVFHSAECTCISVK